MQNMTTITPEQIKTLIMQAACGMGDVHANIKKAYTPCRNALIHCKDLAPWQCLHDTFDSIPAFTKYARRMEQYADCLLGLYESLDANNNPIPWESDNKRTILWNRKTKKFEIARGGNEDLDRARKLARRVDFIKFKVGKREPDPQAATQAMLESKVETQRKSVKRLFALLRKEDNGTQAEIAVVNFMCELGKSKITPSTYVKHMLAAHNAAMAQKLAGTLAELAETQGKETQE